MEFYYNEVDKDVLVLRADGGLSAQNAHRFVGDLVKLVDAGLKRIIIDCGPLGYISSYGLSLLLRIRGKLRERGADVKVCSVKGIISDALRVLGMSRILGVYRDVNEARLAFRMSDAERKEANNIRSDRPVPKCREGHDIS